MNGHTKYLVLMLGLSAMTVAQGQTSVRGSAESRNSTSATVDGNGASASSRSASGAAVEGRQGSSTFGNETEMQAELAKDISTRNMEPGDEVSATLTEDAESNGVFLRKGTRLVGHVTEARRRGEANSSGSAQSRLAMVFDRAVPESGPQVPLNATIQALAAAESHERVASNLGGATSRGSSRATAGGLARTSGGVVGGAGGIAGGIAGSAGGLTRTSGGIAGGAVAGARGAGSAGGSVSRVGSARTRVGSAANGALGAGSSSGALGGLNATGRFASGSRGVFGMDDVNVVRAGGAAQATGSVITSSARHVKLESGTRMLLVTGAAVR
jgi:hypothetical protein